MARPVSGASLGLTSSPGGPPHTSDALAAFEQPERSRYVDGAPLGRGGMGEIRTAYDARLGRTVAIKTPADHAAVSQFVAEATLTARLVHPGIVAVHDAGCTPQGRPYYTMPIVQGRSLAEAIADTSSAQRLRLVRHFLDACEAVAYAHGRGVVHRDLKPSNILVGRFGETIVADWGLAGHVDDEPSGVVGTPVYMPPEQARGAALGPTADVFALGVTLREIVTGSPSGTPGPDAPPELLAIVTRATQASPAARYPNGHALAQDISAWFEGRRVAAHRYSVRELFARLWAAQQIPLLAAMLTILGISIATAVGYRRTAMERSRAQQSEQEALAARERAERSLAHAEIAQAQGAMARGSWRPAELLAAGALLHGPSATARGVLARFDPATRPRLVRRQSMPRCSRTALSARGDWLACARDSHIRVSEPGVPWESMQPLDASGDPVAVLGPGKGIVVDHSYRGLQLVPAGSNADPITLHIATSSPKQVLANDAGALAWVAGTSERWRDESSGHIETTQWCEYLGRSIAGVVGQRPDGLRLSVCQNGSVYVSRGRHEPGHELLTLPAALGGPLVLAFSRSESGQAAVGLAGGSVVLLDLDQGHIMRTFASETGTPFDLALTESRLALSDGHDSVYIWELSNGALVMRLSASRARLRWLDQGHRLQVIGTSLEEWALSPTRARPHVQTTDAGIAALSISPDGQTILTAHGNGDLRLGRVDEREPLAVLPLNSGVVKDVEFSPDGRHAVIACAQADHLFMLDLDEVLNIGEIPSVAGRRIAWLNGDELLLATYQGGVNAWRHENPVASPWPEYSPRIVDMESDADRSGATLIDSDGWVSRWVSDEALGPRSVAHRPNAMAVVGNAHHVYVVRGSTLEAIASDGGSRVVSLPGGLVTELAVSADDRWLALGLGDGKIWLWSTTSLEPIAVLAGHVGRVSAMAFDATGEWLVTGSWDGDVRQWSLHSLETSPEALLAEAEDAWGMSLDELLEIQSGPTGEPTASGAPR